MKDHFIHNHSQAVVEAKTNFVPNSPWSFTTRYLTSWKSAASVSPYHSRPVAFWSLSAFEQLQGLPHHQRHIRCLSRVWSGTTLRRASVQLSKPFKFQRHLQCKTCGTTRLRSQTSSTWTTDDRRRAAGLSQQRLYFYLYEQQRTHLCLVKHPTKHLHFFPELSDDTSVRIFIDHGVVDDSFSAVCIAQRRQSLLVVVGWRTQRRYHHRLRISTKIILSIINSKIPVKKFSLRFAISTNVGIFHKFPSTTECLQS